MDAMKTIDQYLAALRDDQRTALQRLRRTIRAIVPRAEECISYGVPAFRLDGRVLVWFAAAAKHCSFFPGAVLPGFEKELKGFSTGKGTVRFQPERPRPAALVRKLVTARIARIAAKTSSSGGTMPKKPGRNANSTASKPNRRARAKVSKPKHTPTPGLYGWITHTDLSSRDPAGTKAWCAKVLGWAFKPAFPTPTGDYHLFAYSDIGGGGIRPCDPHEAPGSIPFVHVADAQAAFDAALRAGAEAIHPPERVMEGVTVAQVRAPGGVVVGFSGP
jgi:uncharacterized protein YdhG (YjbR/CyaY superfamily)/predicted enzyme related to lactoylglutathione lyase